MRLKKQILAWGTREKDVRQLKKCFENELAIKREKGIIRASARFSQACSQGATVGALCGRRESSLGLRMRYFDFSYVG